MDLLSTLMNIVAVHLRELRNISHTDAFEGSILIYLLEIS